METENIKNSNLRHFKFTNWVFIFYNLMEIRRAAKILWESQEGITDDSCLQCNGIIEVLSKVDNLKTLDTVNINVRKQKITCVWILSSTVITIGPSQLYLNISLYLKCSAHSVFQKVLIVKRLLLHWAKSNFHINSVHLSWSFPLEPQIITFYNQVMLELLTPAKSSSFQINLFQIIPQFFIN